jgi:Uma2 family endonuclease
MNAESHQPVVSVIANKPRATRDDLDTLPGNIKGEIIDGVLYTMPRPRPRHQGVLGAVYGDLRGPFQLGRGGPGGWLILPEPGIELVDAPEISPDVAGWRRERLAALPKDEPIRLVPDWVCEVLSPSTRRYDLLIKRPFYARIGVAFVWYLDLDASTLTASRNLQGAWVEVGVFGDERAAHIPPFDAIEIDVASWWSSMEAAIAPKSSSQP